MGATEEIQLDDMIKNEYVNLRSIVHRICETENKSELIDLEGRAMMYLNCIISLNVKRINERMDGQ